MDSQQTNLGELLLAPTQNCRFSVPAYQREYVWETKGSNEQVAEFWGDIYEQCYRARRAHFLGVLVFQRRETASFENAWDIVDGQQRIISSCLLYLAVRDLILETRNEIPPVLSKFSNGSQPVSLPDGPNKDGFVYNCLVSSSPEGLHSKVIQQSKLLLAYQYFRTMLVRHFGDDQNYLDDFLKRVNELSITLCVFLDNRDPAGVIFETLNGRGRAVDPVDLVKNLILGIGERNTSLKSNALDLWKLLTSEFDEQDLQCCLTALGERDGIRTVRRTPYSELKEDIDEAESKGKLREWLVTSEKAVEIYGDILSPKADQEKLSRLARLDANRTLDSVILRIVELDSADSILIDALESVYLRIYMHYSKPSFRLRKLVDNVCSFFGSHFFCEGDWKSDFLGALKDFWISDADFEEAILKKRVYGQGVKRRRLFYIFERIESALANNLPTKIQFNMSLCSIEHVMPQTLSAEWRNTLPAKENINAIHDSLVHTLGNLTVLLFTHNARLQNQAFQRKKTLYLDPDRYTEEERRDLGVTRPAKGPIKNCVLNSVFADAKIWDFDAIRLRGKFLAGICKRIWRNYDYYEAEISS